MRYFQIRTTRNFGAPAKAKIKSGRVYHWLYLRELCEFYGFLTRAEREKQIIFARFTTSFLFIFRTIELIAYLEPSKTVPHNQMLTSFEFLDRLKVFKDVNLRTSQIRVKIYSSTIIPTINTLVFLFALQNRPWPAGFPFSTVRDQKDNNHSW